MSRRHALAYVALAAVLVSALWITTPVPPPAAPSPQVETLPPQGETHGPVVEAVTIEAGEHRVRAVRRGRGWELLEPAGGKVSDGLIDRLLEAVLHSRIEQVSAGGGTAADYGLDPPRARITLSIRGGAQSVLQLGGYNPTGTAMYGRLEGSPQVLLVGLDIWSYVDLALR
ncbi:MAG: DUF4340 domain-containing protein [Candidatus Binatia bacterium]